MEDPLAHERDGISFAPVLRGEKAALDEPELHRVAILVEKPVCVCVCVEGCVCVGGGGEDL